MTDKELLSIIEELGITDPTFFYKSDEEKLKVVNLLNKKIDENRMQRVVGRT